MSQRCIAAWLAWLLFGSCATSVVSDRADEGLSAPAWDVVDDVRVHGDVAWLADDAREGRRAGTPGEHAAAEWLAERMREIGLEPAGVEDTYFQSFEVPLPAVDGGGSYVRAAREYRGEREVVPLSCSSAGELSGALAFRGFGIVHEELGWDDYGDVRLEDHIAVVVRGKPPLPPASTPQGGEAAEQPDWGSTASLFHKVMTAKRLGAVAVIVVQHPERVGESLPALDASRAAVAGVPALLVGTDVFAGLFHGIELASLLERLESGENPREMVVDGHAIVLAADVRREEGVARNVLGLLRGRERTRTVVLGAHFDHLGRGGPGSLAPQAQGQVHNGADDNASGTAAVLEAARVLAAGDPPPCDVLFALWSGEELGLLGSEHWARYPTVDLAGVRANVNLDMVGRAGHGQLSVLGAGTAEPFAAWLADAGPAVGLELKVSLSGQGVGGSDHQTFLKRGIPALHLFSGVHADYHKPSDDVERVHADGIVRVVLLTVELAQRMAAAPELAFVEVQQEQSEGRRAGSFRVRFGSVPEYAYDGSGVLLAGTSAGSPAEKAGLLAGDVLIGVGDVEIETIHDFVYALGLYKPGDVVLARYLRDDEEQSVRMTLEAPASERE